MKFIHTLLATFAIFIAAPTSAQINNAIKSQLVDETEALMYTGFKLALDCRAKSDNLSKAEVAKLIKRMRVDESALQDPFVALLAEKSKQYMSKDCRSIDEDGLQSALAEINKTKTISFLGTSKSNQKELDLTQFSAASGIMSAIRCRNNRGEFESPKQRTDAMGSAFKRAGVPLHAAIHGKAIEASIELSEELDSTCNHFKDSDKAVKILMKYFNEI